MAGPGKIDLNNSAWQNLAEVAKFAIGSNERLDGDPKKITGGAGRIGMVGGYVVKFNTHASERRSGPKANQDMRDSCNALRESLYKIAQDLGVDDKTLKDIRSKLGILKDGTIPAKKKLLDRTVVVSVINRIGADQKIKGVGTNVWSKMGLTSDAIKDLASTKVDATGKKTKLDTNFSKIFMDCLPPERKAEMMADGRLRIEQHGFLGMWGAAMYAKGLVEEAEKDRQDGVQAAKDVGRETVLRLDGKADLSNKDLRTDQGKMGEMEAGAFMWGKFKEHFPNDEDFARCVSRIANQTLLNTGGNVQTTAFIEAKGGDNKWFKEEIKSGHLHISEQIVEISSVKNDSVTITVTREAVPKDVMKTWYAETQRKVDENSSYETLKYSVRVTKLGADDDKTGQNVAKVGGSYFRFDVDPLSRIDAHIVSAETEDAVLKDKKMMAFLP